jgi:protoporphyrinogen oxidase
MGNDCFILGAGITGLAAGWASGLPIFEASSAPGGLCRSYYMRPGGEKRLSKPSSDSDVFRFETGGGHWLFGADQDIGRFLGSFDCWELHRRFSGILLGQDDRILPYPLQYNLRSLGPRLARKAVSEIRASAGKTGRTMREWLENRFGKTLGSLFFFPFHEKYTAGLYERIAPEDKAKSPNDLAKIIKGIRTAVPDAGYNRSFIYPVNGLDALVRGLAEKCCIYYGRRVTRIDTERRAVYFSDGKSLNYSRLISTLPINQMMAMAGFDSDAPAPYCSVLVLNMGVRRGKKYPDCHWLYLPKSKAGYFRVGFYSNVTDLFLPVSSRGKNDLGSLYLERAYPGGVRPAKKEIDVFTRESLDELQKSGFIKEVLTMDTNWIEIAYTWNWPNSRWRENSLAKLRAKGIFQIGRYGGWHFQGIVDSLREGLSFDRRNKC